VSLIGDAKMDILRSLCETPSYGYELQQELGLNKGTVYVHLKELREAGMIEIDRVEDDTKYYRLTDDGKQLLAALD
jgi:DNA-binding PadR family transcriptional regulator